MFREARRARSVIWNFQRYRKILKHHFSKSPKLSTFFTPNNLIWTRTFIQYKVPCFYAASIGFKLLSKFSGLFNFYKMGKFGSYGIFVSGKKWSSSREYNHSLPIVCLKINLNVGEMKFLISQKTLMYHYLTVEYSSESMWFSRVLTYRICVYTTTIITKSSDCIKFLLLNIACKYKLICSFMNGKENENSVVLQYLSTTLSWSWNLPT